MISALSVSVIPHLVHPRKAVDLPERIPPQRIGHLGGCIGQVFNPSNSIGTAVQHVTGCWFAPLLRRDTALRHHRAPDSTGCLLRDPLAVTRAGPPPAGRRQLRTRQRLVRQCLLLPFFTASFSHEGVYGANHPGSEIAHYRIHSFVQVRILRSDMHLSDRT